VLGYRPYTVAIGIAYVFKDQEAEAQYFAARAFTRRLEYRTDLVEEFSKSKLARRYVSLASRLGRLPLPEEFPKLDQLWEVFGSPQRVARLALRHIDYEAFSGSQGQRREDILTYFSMMRLQGLKPPPFLKLPISVQADIKEIWKTYRTALTECERYLFSLGNSEVIQKACASSPVGKHLPSHIYVHESAEDELPALLRIVIFAAKQIVGEVPYNIAKIAVDGRTVSFLDYPNFDQNPHPTLLRSVQVYLPKTSFNIRDYSKWDNPPILHRKDTFVTKTYPYFETFRQLTVQEEAEGLLSNSDIGFKQAWDTFLQSRGFYLKDHELQPLRTKSDHHV
jgi:DNA phosphorothioation-associated putative methyltransferase